MASLPADEKYGYEDSRFEKEVDTNFHCSICYNVLKEPMMCEHNEHIFCRACITEHLTVNSRTCPECNDGLTVETLRRAPRVLINYLSELKINCDYSSRGCQEFVCLEELDGHVENCGFAPVKCSNEECEVVVNKRELIHHETAVCEYRKVKCHNCVKIEQDVEEIKVKIEEMKEIQELKAMMAQMFEKLGFLENAIQVASAINHASNALMEDIFIAGGYHTDGSNSASKSAERFSWKKNTWEMVSPMNVARIGATSFVYRNQLFIAGGSGSDAIEVLDLNADLPQWHEFWGALPYHCYRLRSVVYQNRAILFCACREAVDVGRFAELNFTAPYKCKPLYELPELERKTYSVVPFENKVLIFGGSSLATNDLLNSVLQFDINTNEFKAMPPLPYAVNNLAAVRWGDQAVLIGGFGEDDQSNKVIMYDSKSGKITVLPSMLEERAGCCAIITGNTIVVMGGRRKHPKGRVRSVEAFTLGGYSWRYLPDMNNIRSAATATVLPTRN